MISIDTGHNEPDYSISVDGIDKTGGIKKRLMSLTLTDNRGFEADQLDIEFDDADGKVELPRRGAKIAVSLGWKGAALIDKGTFTVDEIEHSGAPDKLTVRARSADFRETLNIRRDQSYHKTTIGGIIKTVAERNKLAPTLNKTMFDLTIDHIDQTNESDGNFITRLAKQYGAIAAVKNGNLLFIRQGQSKTASGKPIPAMTIIRSLGDGHQFSMADRGAYTGVVANWLNTRTAEKPVVKVKRKRKRKATTAAKPKEPEEKQGEYLIGTDENVLILRTTYASKNNAQRAAKSNWERIQRGVAKFSIQLAKGRADLYPEVPVKVTGFKKQIDEADWTLVTVTHSVSDSGFTTALELEVKIDDLDME
ncbi:MULTISPECIES: phage late control D family protein [Yersinia pseudotuberculosis complex]|uniref:Late control gene D protein n=3 Tax=Yersinia pseudotuberculosis TaxID=633 RepID=A0A0U1R2N4_YERP3|nr:MULTISPECIES: phage late control D family protein [Yersinia pseudotuberculosis complex]ABS49545.1 late control gene D protein [Yersinia pseudotuberculosis IP 31758]MCE4114738.1 phage late control D family protein [Yersinia pseudotuberculosis]RYC18709.1 phage late control D family protein [Yersinia pseudotuberculosis]UFA61866.1 Phage tail formation protein D [Yersinia pseudotuberculosis]WLF02175.1 phage late control D family protein [Yersinia pseudotuberculosis]